MTILSETIYVDAKLKEEQQFFELRQQLKESIRKKMRKESGCPCNISQENKKLPGDNYGSFFGHSQPSIARRVIKESKFVLEAKQSAAKFKNSSALKADVVMQKMKAHKLKASRDYSFIFSDNSENLTSVSSTMGKATQQQMKHLDEIEENYEPKKAEQMSKQVQLPKCKVSAEHKISLSKKSNKQCKKFLEPCNAKVRPKQVKSIEKLKSEEKIKVGEHKKAKVIENKLQCSSKGQASDMDKANCFPKQLERKKEVNEASRLESSSQNKGLNGLSKASLIIKLKIPRKLQIGKEIGICKPNNEVFIPTQKKSYKTHEQKKEPEDNLCYGSEVDKGYVSSLCQSLFRRNHKKRVRDDYEDNGDCMVASFADIEREERISAKIARKEDKIEQLLSEQEEMKERLRRQSKKHKLHHN